MLQVAKRIIDATRTKRNGGITLLLDGAKAFGRIQPESRATVAEKMRFCFGVPPEASFEGPVDECLARWKPGCPSRRRPGENHDHKEASAQT